MYSGTDLLLKYVFTKFKTCLHKGKPEHIKACVEEYRNVMLCLSTNHHLNNTTANVQQTII